METTTAKKLAQLNALYSECQTREATPEEAARMQSLYNELAEEAALGMWSSPRDGQYFFMEAK